MIFTIKDTKLYVLIVTLSAKDNQKLSKHLSKGLERPYLWNRYNAKSQSKNRTNDHSYFPKSKLVAVNRLFVLIYLNKDDDGKRLFTKHYYLKHYLPKGIAKNYHFIISRKNFYNQPIDSDIKRYKEIRKLTTGLGENYTTWYLLDYEYIKNHYKLVAVDFSSQKEIGGLIQKQSVKYNLLCS